MWLFWFASAWIWFGNGTGCAFVLGTATLYGYVLSEPLVSLITTQLETDILQYFTPTIWICYAVIAGHAVLAVRTSRRIFRQRRHARQTRVIYPTVAVTTAPTQSETEPAHPSTQPEAQNCGSPIVPTIRRREERPGVSMIMWWTRYNAEITRLFMIWEIANQMYQANKMSRLIASVWINRLVALVIVANCWFSLVLQFAMRSRPSTHVRLARLLLDSCLDVVYNIGIPVVIFYPYYRDYCGGSSLFPVINYYMDTWYAGTVSELRQVFVTSWVDLVSKATGSIALLYRIYVVEKVLRRAQDFNVASRQETDSRELDSDQETATHPRSRVSKSLDAVLLLCGLTVVCLHTHSTIVAYQGERVGCLLEARPWGSSTYSCMVIEVSCVERNITGRHLAILEALDHVDPHFVQVLIFSHCPQLEVPSVVQDFVALSMVKVYNTTILTWDETAAIHQTMNPALQVLYFARVNMSELPAGLLARDFPETVWDIEFCVTNLTTIPDAVVEAWRHVVYFAIEATPLLTEAPDSILRLPSIVFLRLGMNSIRSIPDWGFADQEFVILSLDGNPLTHLPPTIKTLKQMGSLSFEGTAVSNFPIGWLTAEPPSGGPTSVSAATSSLCETLGNPASPTVIGPFAVECHTRMPSMVAYPLEDEDKWRLVHRS
jgi:hypothetical protein